MDRRNVATQDACRLGTRSIMQSRLVRAHAGRKQSEALTATVAATLRTFSTSTRLRETAKESLAFARSGTPVNNRTETKLDQEVPSLVTSWKDSCQASRRHSQLFRQRLRRRRGRRTRTRRRSPANLFSKIKRIRSLFDNCDPDEIEPRDIIESRCL